jgi:hypothetical protein
MWYAEEEVGRTASVYFNENTGTANQPPAAPANLSAEVDGENVTLSWDEATDDMTPAASLSYEYFLQDGEGNYMIAPAAFVGGDMDGKRKLLKMGNAFLNKFVILKGLAPDTYTWGVQAIDASYDGSTFATGTFKISGVGIDDRVNERISDIFAYDHTLVVRMKDTKDATVSVFNVVGQKIVTKNIRGEFRMNLDQGIYLVRVETESQIQTGKVFVK